MRRTRLSTAQLADHFARERPEIRRLVRAVRRIVLTTVPNCAEAFRYGCMSYFLPDAPYGAIGGNVCMIEVRRGAVSLSFIHGAKLPDPHGLLRGRAKSNRYLPIATPEFAADRRVTDLLRAAEDLVQRADLAVVEDEDRI